MLIGVDSVLFAEEETLIVGELSSALPIEVLPLPNAATSEESEHIATQHQHGVAFIWVEGITPAGEGLYMLRASVAIACRNLRQENDREGAYEIASLVQSAYPVMDSISTPVGTGTFFVESSSYLRNADGVHWWIVRLAGYRYANR